MKIKHLSKHKKRTFNKSGEIIGKCRTAQTIWFNIFSRQKKTQKRNVKTYYRNKYAKYYHYGTYKRENAPYELEVSANDCCVDHVDDCQLC